MVRGFHFTVGHLDRQCIHRSCTAESVLITLSITALGTNKMSLFQLNVGV
jgi:hypothetical protein